MTEFRITDKLIVDDECEFPPDINRAVELINLHRPVAVGTFFDALAILQELGFTDASIRILFEKAAEGHQLDEIYNALGWGEPHALPR